MRQRDAERKAKKFVRTYYPHVAHWHFDICEETGARYKNSGKVWSFGLVPDQEDEDYQKGRYMVGYVHADGAIEGLY